MLAVFVINILGIILNLLKHAMLITLELLLYLFLIAVIAGFFDTLAGGGGLITVPALIVTGMPVLSALGTNKLQGATGTATATYLMLKNKRVSWDNIKLLMLATFIGSALGTLIIQFVNTDVLSIVIPFVLLAIAIYFLINPKPKNKVHKAKMSDVIYQRLIVPLIGLYDGMFGPGTGSFFAMAEVSYKNKGLIDATAVAKTLNFSTNIASLIVFIFAGKVIWLVGVVMMVGQVLGAWIGSSYLYKINPEYLRFMVVAICLVMTTKYVLSAGWFS
jgi:uncharacterized membrane protein YfcA